MHTLLRVYTYQYLITCAFFLSYVCILFSLIIWCIIRWCLNLFKSSSSCLRSHFPLYHHSLEHQLDRIDDKILAISNGSFLLSQLMNILQGQIILRDLYVNVVGCVLKNNSDALDLDYTILFHTFLKCGTKICKIIINIGTPCTP